MTKVRVYELAKELGVDNRIVISKAMELGIPGVKSHSNSMDGDEAEQIRKALIKNALGGASHSNGSSVASETVTRRVVGTSSAGTTEAIVEKRSGNVIRRRRTHEEEVKPEVIEEQLQAHTQTEESEKVSGSVSSDIFSHKEESIEEKVEAIESEERTEVEDIVEDNDLIDNQETPEAVVVRNPRAPIETPSTIATVPKTAASPRILGKIDLPIRKTPAPTGGTSGSPSRNRFDGSAAPRLTTFEDDESDANKAKAKKGKRREVTRFDLVDGDRDARRGPRGLGGRSKKKEERSQEDIEATKMKASKRVVKMAEMITVGDLSKQMSVKAGEVIAKLIELGVMATINQALDKDIVTIVAEEFEYTVESTSLTESEMIEEQVATEEGEMLSRPPVVTIMGHVDHGKTSLLDAIRSASVADREHGGITQHIGAYQVTAHDKLITFIDTPGHAAFTSMRARGAQVTDVVILVVAADDGVMPQTIEALNHAKAANVPIIVAVNKMDKPNINPDRVKQQLTEHGIQPEEWGGDTMFIPVSALAKTGLTELLEAILLQAEVLELKAVQQSRARGTIIESRQDRGRGVVGTVLVQSGTLRVGDIFVCGADTGRVRSMTDHKGTKLTEALPATPVEITGYNAVPAAGDDFFVVESESKAKQIVSLRDEKRAKEERALAAGPISLEEFSRRANNIQSAELNIILKADVHGSVEAVRNSVEQLSTEKVRVKVVHAAVGGISESDIQLAIASKAIVVGFNIRAEPRATAEAERSGVELRFYRIIYELIDDMKLAMVGLLEPIKQESELGRAEVRQTFVVPKMGTIAGSFVKHGVIKRGALLRLLRDGKIIFEGKMASLRRFKDDAREVQTGYECGIGIEGYNDIKPGDEIQAYEMKEIAPEL